jgi:hypothetical protein
VLTEAAINGKVDQLRGLKENVIIGKLIPARAELDLPPLPPRPPREALPGFFEGGLRELTRAETDGGDVEEDEEDFEEGRTLRLLQAEDRSVDLSQLPLEVEGSGDGEVESIAPIEATGRVALATDNGSAELDFFGDDDEDEE